jgi:DNA-directed RNA polymerase specialized sigma24 family protein
LDTASCPSTSLSEFYRFALLLSGSVPAAEAALAAAFGEAGEHLCQMRSEGQRRVCLAMHIRQYCLAHEEAVESKAPRLLREPSGEGVPEVLKIEAYILAQRFRRLPEPGRSALALFYLDLFEVGEIAALLQMRLEELGAALGRARGQLQEALRAAPAPEPVPA